MDPFLMAMLGSSFNQVTHVGDFPSVPDSSGVYIPGFVIWTGHSPINQSPRGSHWQSDYRQIHMSCPPP